MNGPKTCRRPVVKLSRATKSYRVNRPLRVLKLAVIRYPNAVLVVVLASIGVRGFKHTIYFATELVFPHVFLAWKIFIIFQVVVVGPFHSITPSLLDFPLDIWKSG